MALQYSGIKVEHREIELRNKPQSMLLASPKGTVPVLIVDDLILDQSLEIIHWALQKSDPDNWSEIDKDAAQIWIEKNDGPFKVLLDQYKYPNRHPNLNQNLLNDFIRVVIFQNDVLNTAIELLLKPMDDALKSSQFLLGDKQSWLDVAIFPFIRQFSMVNLEWFDQLPLTALKKWLAQFLQSELFNAVMYKYPTWKD